MKLMKPTTGACLGSLAAAIVAVGGCSSTNSDTTTPSPEAGTLDDGSGGSSGGSGSSSSGATDGMSAAETSAPSSEAGGEAGLYGNTGQPACDAIDLPAPASGAGSQFQIPQTLGPGQEREVCQLVKVGQDMDINSSVGLMSDPSHHAVVYATPYNGSIPAVTLDGQTLDGTLVHTCSTPTALWSLTGVIATANHVSTPNSGGGLPALPSNVAYKVKAGDYILLNFHLLNPTNQTLNACYKVNLNTIPDSQVTQEAGYIFWYNPFITVPANGTSTARMACPITSNVTMGADVSHAHARLTQFVANLLSGDPEATGTTTVQELYSGTAWDLPPFKVFSTPVTLTAGQWIDYHCDYTNLENRNVAQGLQTTDEMCMYQGTYWPRDLSLENCVSAAGNIDEAGRNYGYGTKTGADFLSCFWTTPQAGPAGCSGGGCLSGGPATSAARYAAYGCVTQTCPKASGPITPYLDCVGSSAASCQAQCSDLQSSFQAICASTPNSDPVPADAGSDAGAASVNGCKAQYGTDGSDGTCAAQAQAAAIASSTTPAQTAELTRQCQQTFCAAQCTADASIPDGGVSCAACVGAFSGSTSDPTCLNQLTLAAVAAQTKTLAQACVTQCFTGCITSRATSCTLDCINSTACGSQYAAVASATCN